MGRRIVQRAGGPAARGTANDVVANAREFVHARRGIAGDHD
jgi:hypothetical protein